MPNLTISRLLTNNAMQCHPNITPQRKMKKKSSNCLLFIPFRLSLFVLIKNKMEQIQFDIVKFLSSVSDKQKKEFCLEKCDFHFPANQEISCNLFTVLLDIAANFVTNRNKTIQNMLRQINCEIGNINVSGLVKKYNNRLRKLNN